MAISHQYAFDAARLLGDCISHLQDVVELDTRGNHTILYELKEALLGIEGLLELHFFRILQAEAIGENFKDILADFGNGTPPLSKSTMVLRTVLDIKHQVEQSQGQSPSPTRRHRRVKKSATPKHRSHTPIMAVSDLGSKTNVLQGYSASRSATDSLLFRLIVALQLCLVRIDDAMFVIGGHRRSGGNRILGKTPQGRKVRSWVVTMGYCGGVVGTTAYLLRNHRHKAGRNDSQTIAMTFAKVSASAYLVAEMAKQWKSLWMTSKLEKSMGEIEEWKEQWLLVNYETKSDSQQGYAPQHVTNAAAEALDAIKSRRLIEYALREHSHKVRHSSNIQNLQYYLIFYILDKTNHRSIPSRFRFGYRKANFAF